MFSAVAFPVKLNDLSDCHLPRYDSEIVSKCGVPACIQTAAGNKALQESKKYFSVSWTSCLIMTVLCFTLPVRLLGLRVRMPKMT